MHAAELCAKLILATCRGCFRSVLQGTDTGCNVLTIAAASCMQRIGVPNVHPEHLLLHIVMLSMTLFLSQVGGD